MNVLITGKNGYIANSAKEYLSNRGIRCEAVSVRDNIPNFSSYDAVVHAAAIVHIRERDPDKYYAVNTRLTQELAEEAKSRGIGQFIFLSSMAVYGEIQSSGIIDRSTPVNPCTHYGKSKAMAESILEGMESINFKTAIIRIPMVYGKNCSGNFGRLNTLASRLPVFPFVNNKRSMLYIDNLCELLRLILVNDERGVFYPQNREYVTTSKLVQDMRLLADKKTVLSPLMGKLVRSVPLEPVGKLFGDLVYDKYLSSHFDYAYCVTDYWESLKYSCNPIP